MKKRNIVIILGAFFSILTLSGIGFWLFSFYSRPTIYPHKEELELDDNYQFHTDYGNLNDTLQYALHTNMNTTYYQDPDYYAWTESYIQDALVNYFKTTKNETILHHLLLRIENVIANIDHNNDGIPGFGSSEYTENYTEYLAWDGKILSPIAELAKIVKSDPTLNTNSTLMSQMDQYIDLCELVISKWNQTHWQEVDNYGYYVSPPENTTAIFNRIHAMGNLIIEVYQYTQNSSYLIQLTKISQFFKNHLIKRTFWSDGKFQKMYVWGYDWNSENSDTSHGCIDIRFVINCYQLNITFQHLDMVLFANTFFDVVFRGTFSGVIFSDFVNGENSDLLLFYSMRSGWLRLYEYYRNPDLAKFIIQKSIESIINEGYFYTVTLGEALSYLYSNIP